jgi:hypothetical protein
MRFQLRMYRIKPGEMQEWIHEWRELVLPLRRSRGFTVLGPWTRRDEDLFVWLIGHDDLEGANESYYSSRERRAFDPDPARHLAEAKTWILDSLDRPNNVGRDAETDEDDADEDGRLEA